MHHHTNLPGLSPPHPGAILREDVLPELGLPRATIARYLGLSPEKLDALLDERDPVTPGLALRLSRLVGGSPEIWLDLQRDYDLRTLEPQIAEELEAIPHLHPGG